ncbi:hypothetical protein [Merismopedia glauca]|uniref:Uncharacterized protein n=1 Tax=Merismopedia glauca CCAP 1448/3 TaxID=1296344 RepID=A0A2T1C615_9CYAN|nr:hypothetical protein [Merismopedia glauca]PSB03573.1 hypothetical protein C7B64_07945 [Merismopedia glauca CCAP 1448/3]
MKKILILAILTTLFAAPAFAGDLFVFGQWTLKHERTEEDTDIDYTTTSNRREDYSSSSNSIYFKGNTVHRAGSELIGTFHEENKTRVWGKSNTITNSYERTQESSAGIR